MKEAECVCVCVSVCVRLSMQAHIHMIFLQGTSLVAQGLRLHASSARGAGSIPGQANKIPCVAWFDQKNKMTRFSCREPKNFWWVRINIPLSQCYFPVLDGIYWYYQPLPESTCGERFSLSFQKFSILVLTEGKRTTETKSHFGLVRFHFIISGGKKWIEYAHFFISQECVLPSISFMLPPQTPRCDSTLISNQFLATKRY